MVVILVIYKKIIRTHIFYIVNIIYIIKNKKNIIYNIYFYKNIAHSKDSIFSRQ